MKKMMEHNHMGGVGGIVGVNDGLEHDLWHSRDKIMKPN